VLGQLRSMDELERLEEVLARWILLTLIHHRVGRKVRESIVRLVPMVEQDSGTSVGILAEAIRNVHVLRGHAGNNG